MIPFHSYLTPDVQCKLDLSSQETIDLAQRDLRCPNCRYLISKVYGDIKGHLEFKCPKCRELYVINLSYFRTRSHNRYITITRVIQKI